MRIACYLSSGYDDDDLLCICVVSKLVMFICCQSEDTGDFLLQRVRIPMTVCCVSRLRKLMIVCFMESRCQCCMVYCLKNEYDDLLRRVRMLMTAICMEIAHQ
jgi:hypothetical protein